MHPKCVKSWYLQASGPGLRPLDPTELLQMIADFASLECRKVLARLEHFLSPADKLPAGKGHRHFDLRTSDFVEIPERSNVGCGEIAGYKLEELLGENVAAKRSTSIQVRIFGPGIGVFKGMLVRNNDMVVGPPIRLPPSMRKVGPSRTADDADWAILIICKNGIHPSRNNWYFGRLLDPDARDPPKSFTPKPISKTVAYLWRGPGVPANVVADYEARSASRQGLMHATLNGVSDYTNLLPAGHVFVPGLGRLAATITSMFVARHPIISSDAGLVVPVVTAKPDEMSHSSWESLQNLSFGCILFANAREGTKSLPEMINKGDLDGDWYFVCFDPVIRGHLRDPFVTDVPAEVAQSAVPVPSSENGEDWFLRAQDLQVNSVYASVEIRHLIGSLYNIYWDTAESSDAYMNDRDAKAFADAYDQALEFMKHGRPIVLREDLQEKVKPALRKYLVAPN